MLSRLLGPIFAAVARTGEGTSECLQHGFLPVPLHFYQPIFDPDSMEIGAWGRRHEMAGVSFDAERRSKTGSMRTGRVMG